MPLLFLIYIGDLTHLVYLIHMAVTRFYMQMSSCSFMPSKVRRMFQSVQNAVSIIDDWVQQNYLTLVNVNLWLH